MKRGGLRRLFAINWIPFLKPKAMNFTHLAVCQYLLGCDFSSGANTHFPHQPLLTQSFACGRMQRFKAGQRDSQGPPEVEWSTKKKSCPRGPKGLNRRSLRWRVAGQACLRSPPRPRLHSRPLRRRPVCRLHRKILLWQQRHLNLRRQNLSPRRLGPRPNLPQPHLQNPLLPKLPSNPILGQARCSMSSTSDSRAPSQSPSFFATCLR